MGPSPVGAILRYRALEQEENFQESPTSTSLFWKTLTHID